ncbi:MAG: TolC family protein [Gemmatimonadales bacterium]|nr:TolC family protein [Gemmatimonadales bacterium]NIN13044.1 TolC family protein [Gemmatimonadales bacterium]NIN51128.1 TolC family protein [Gemmatimonadales bacterium]NIP08592.1 TolC family protein [Gemmatimonadales bacterium]NIQ99702.1 TolC family protein [Gemmatimonadales bacterium]
MRSTFFAAALHITLTVLGLSLVGATAAPSAAQAQRPRSVRIGTVVDGPWERNDEILGLFQREMTELLSSEFDVRFPAPLDGGWTLDGVRSALDGLLADPAVDLVLAFGVLASADAARRGDLPKPVIAPFVFNPELQDLPLTDSGTTGVPNLSYLAHPASFEENMPVFQEVVRFRRLGVLLSAAYSEGAPSLWTGMQAAAEAMGLEAVLVPVGRVADSVLAAIPADVEAVYVTPLVQLLPGEFDRLVNGLIAKRLPSFSFMGVEEVQRGILVGLSPETSLFRLARRVALNVQRILLGEDAGGIPVAIAYGERLTINMATARAIGVYPRWRVITEAALINDVRTDIDRRVSLASAAREALEANLDLAAQEQVVAAGRADVRQSWARLLPQAEVSSLGTLIDQDRAQASFGSQAQRTLTGSATVSQVIFSEPAWADVSVQRRLQAAREYERDAVELDIVLDAILAYLNVLRGNTFERIQRENVSATRSNLELARVRVTLGMAGPGEPLRWESQIAANRQEVIAANTRRNLAEIQLNRLLHRPLEERFVTEDADLADLPLVGAEASILPYMDNPYSFRVLRAFMVEEALATSPELRQLDEAIGAQGRGLQSARRSYFAPTVALQGGLTGLLTEGGAGAEFTLALPPGSPDLSDAFPQANDLSWSLGLRVSLPLFTGGARAAAVAAAVRDSGAAAARAGSGRRAH